MGMRRIVDRALRRRQPRFQLIRAFDESQFLRRAANGKTVEPQRRLWFAIQQRLAASAVLARQQLAAPHGGSIFIAVAASALAALRARHCTVTHVEQPGRKVAARCPKKTYHALVRAFCRRAACKKTRGAAGVSGRAL